MNSYRKVQKFYRHNYVESSPRFIETNFKSVRFVGYLLEVYKTTDLMYVMKKQKAFLARYTWCNLEKRRLEKSVWCLSEFQRVLRYEVPRKDLNFRWEFPSKNDQNRLLFYKHALENVFEKKAICASQNECQKRANLIRESRSEIGSAGKTMTIHVEQACRQSTCFWKANSFEGQNFYWILEKFLKTSVWCFHGFYH